VPTPNSSRQIEHDQLSSRTLVIKPAGIGRLLQGLGVGLVAPLDSLRFLRRNKLLLVLGLTPQVLGLAAFLALGIEWMGPALTTAVLGWFPESWNVAALGFLVTSMTAILLLITYTLIWIPLVGVIASPLYDMIASRSYAAASGMGLPTQSVTQAIGGLVSEGAKLVIYFALLAMAFVVPPLAPFFLAFAVWYLGWDIVDRTLGQSSLTLGQRLRFGIKNPLACMALGLWAYLPLVGALLAFAFAAAGGIVAARLGIGETASSQRLPPTQRPS
jgi:uncharacterized protein involved in cysteine biosynthesis